MDLLNGNLVGDNDAGVESDVPALHTPPESRVRRVLQYWLRKMCVRIIAIVAEMVMAMMTPITMRMVMG